MSVDWIDKTYRFGIGLQEKEAKAVVNELKPSLPRNDSSNNISTPNRSFDLSVQSKFDGYLSIRPSTHSLAFSSDGKTLTAGSLDSTVRFWEVATGKEIRTLGKKSNYGV